MRVEVIEPLNTRVNYWIDPFTGSYDIYIKYVDEDTPVVRFKNSSRTDQGIYTEDFRRLLREGVLKIVD